MFLETLVRSPFSPAKAALPGEAVPNTQKQRQPLPAQEQVHWSPQLTQGGLNQDPQTGEDTGTQDSSFMGGLLPTGPFPCQSPTPSIRPGGAYLALPPRPLPLLPGTG